MSNEGLRVEAGSEGFLRRSLSRTVHLYLPRNPDRGPGETFLRNLDPPSSGRYYRRGTQRRTPDGAGTSGTPSGRDSGPVTPAHTPNAHTHTYVSYRVCTRMPVPK